MGLRLTCSWALLLLLAIFHLALWVWAEQCGSQAAGKRCSGGLCCSKFGWCGSTTDYCGPKNCQSQCLGRSTAGRGGGLSSIVTSDLFDRFFPHRADAGCPAQGFYTYQAFISASAAFSGFGTASDDTTNRREIAAFFANAAHEVTGGCYKEEIDKSNSYCASSSQWTCASGKKYYGRGPMQISWNYNYGQDGKVIGFDGINNPDIVANDPIVAFKVAIWFSMTPQAPKPSCHNSIISNQGFGKTIDIINGGIECHNGANAAQQDRINLYKQFCSMLGVDPGGYLTC